MSFFLEKKPEIFIYTNLVCPKVIIRIHSRYCPPTISGLLGLGTKQGPPMRCSTQNLKRLRLLRCLKSPKSTMLQKID